ncbi:threonine--tRNA ligase [Candidatus Peregrinibacteria bacterium]|nr:MAG: threonine--tRNA ligase [Candidatus Peregrinibacteria bacterium]
MSDISTQRHDLSHILAAAVQQLFPEVQLGIGPDTDNGFYYDFAVETPFQPEDLRKIEKAMRKLQSQSIAFEQYNMPVDEAIAFLKESNQDLKVELAEDLKKDGETELSFYKNAGFVDMCKGPHMEHTNQSTKHFMLSSLAGAYWRGDATRQMLQRIYGVAFETKDELEAYKEMMKEAKKRDHRVLGKKLGLFTFSEKVGAGLPLFTQKGTMIRNLIVKEIQDLQKKYGYGMSDVCIPHIAKRDLYECSGHWDKYKDDIFHVRGKGETQFVMKPMNCPHHTQIFAASAHSYRDLPIRMTEVTTNYRDELPGELLGLSRVRSITQDDGHIFCTIDQVKQEANTIVQIIRDFYTKLGMFEEGNYWVSLSVRDSKDLSKYLGDTKNWDTAERMLQEVADENGLNYKRIEGEAAFYGPKLDFMFKDAIGREWQLATIQADFVMPERFELEYTGEDGEKHRPVMVHRAIAGSLERFMSVLIEHFAGAFPAWLAPIQVSLCPVADVHEDYAREVKSELEKNNIRVEILDSRMSLGKRIRTAEMQKIPYMITIGDEEVSAKTVSVRSYADKSQEALTLEAFLLLLV